MVESSVKEADVTHALNDNATVSGTVIPADVVDVPGTLAPLVVDMTAKDGGAVIPVFS